MKLYQLLKTVFFKFNVEISPDKKKALSLFCSIASLVILALLFLTAGQIIDFTKTTFNLYELSEDNMVDTAFTLVVLLIVVFYCFFKSLLENLTICLKVFKLKVKISFVSKCTLLVTVVLLASFYAVGNGKIQSELFNRVDDFYKLQKIISLVKENNTAVDVYVSKIPTLYKRAGISFIEKILPFEEIGLSENEDHLAIIDPNCEYKFLLTHGYKYYKVSDTAGLLVKSASIINLLEQFGYKFSDFYFINDFRLEKLGRLNRLKFNPSKGLEIKQNKPLIHTNKIHLLEGKYHFELNLNLSQNNFDKIVELGIFKLTASDKQIEMFTKKITSDLFVDGWYTLSFDIDVDNNYHDVEISVEPTSSNNIYLSKATFSKLKTN